MRPLRFLLALISFVVAFFILVSIGPWGSSDLEEELENGNLRTYFNWRTPSSLFPPSAIISITDDNSTNFVARPAAFGPLLPAQSLSGQLWIGSGFGDEYFERGTGEGELGCSDVPGWEEGSWTTGSVVSGKRVGSDVKAAAAEGSLSTLRKSRRSSPAILDEVEEYGKQVSGGNDGTDDHLHHPLPASDGLKTNGEAAGNTKKPTHADIQSLQESAEIAGKIVLLSRGGCGFLEKVKWVQRRGGIALIVGDDQRGGQLVRMFARGDTSNVTIPSLFTSHTTAQLLSSLMPSGRSLHRDDSSRPRPAVGDGERAVIKERAKRKKKAAADGPNFTTTTEVHQITATPKAQSKGRSQLKASSRQSEPSQRPKICGWLASWFMGCLDHGNDSRRPPSSGNIGWILQEEFEEDDSGQALYGKPSTSSVSPLQTPAANSKQVPSDGFQIGVQDWRDPDLVAQQKEQQMLSSSSMTSSTSTAARAAKAVAPTALRGGSITPSSGEYANVDHEVAETFGERIGFTNDATSQQKPGQDEKSRGWLGRIIHSGSDSAMTDPEHGQHPSDAPPLQAARRPDGSHGDRYSTDEVSMHGALWVTLSPTSMSTSPFFDTLLVLVVSPLVTLTVVYALLLLRSRIRRRRWRAPKSVVERLPVRTYQTISSTTTSSSNSSVASASVTTPLLPAPRPTSTRSRPRARTTSEIGRESSTHLEGMASPPTEQIEEKRAAGLAEWRRRYGGKQRECVVCLEEYVDGVSRVMSLPCGHEFHAECITPWLTTRRRTCPICKGDVVRSLTRSHPSTSASVPHHYREEDEEEDRVQEQVITTVNEDPAAQQPLGREDEAVEDLGWGATLSLPRGERSDRVG